MGEDTVKKMTLKRGREEAEELRGIHKTVLHLAAEAARTETVEAILATDWGGKLAGRKAYLWKKWTPLQLAARNGHADVAALLVETPGNKITTRKEILPLFAPLEGRATIGEDDDDFFSSVGPLRLACEHGHLGVARVLLETEEGVEAACHVKWSTDTPLYLASRRGHLEVVRLLLEIDKVVRAIPEDKEGPLHGAALGGHIDVAKELLKMDEFRATLVAGCRTTPLHLAVKRGHLDVVKLLLEQARLKKANSGNTPLHLASYEGHLEVVELLLQDEEWRQALVINDDGEEHSPLHLASRRGHLGVVKALLATNEGKKAMKSRGYLGNTPLHLASYRNHLPVVKTLLREKGGAEVLTEKNSFSQTPLRMAMVNSHLDVIKEILKTDEGRESIALPNGEGNTALHSAVRRGAEMTRMLMETAEARKAAEIENEDGDTPRDLAEEEDDKEILKAIDDAMTAYVTDDENDEESDGAFLDDPDEEGEEDVLSCRSCLSKFSTQDGFQKPMIVCRNGHTFCQECSLGMASCHACREPCLDTAIVNRIFCEVLRNLILS